MQNDDQKRADYYLDILLFLGFYAIILAIGYFSAHV